MVFHVALFLVLALWSAGFCVAAGFVGSKTCRGCHEPQYTAWQGSHHDLAMQPARVDTVLADFNGARFVYAGTTSRFFRRDGRFFVTTDGPDGKPGEFEIRYTIGVYPLQQYLVAFPDGRIQVLGIAWDTRPEAEGGQRWFHLYPGEVVDYDHELHWTRPQQNWNHICADCHTTGLEKNYDAALDRFATKWAAIDVACEACHGPGANHVIWAGGDTRKRDPGPGKGLLIPVPERAGMTWAMDIATGIARRRGRAISPLEVEVCADCHSRRTTLADGTAASARFLDHHMPTLLTENLYYPDGQVKDEVYVWGSFTQSKMYAAGVTCADCHEPHSLKLRAKQAKVCLQCHADSRFDVPEHHHHKSGTGAPDCLACHMPESTFMVLDKRRDHSIRIPRPDQSVAFGVPNACNRCHDDRTPRWAAGHTKHWYPDGLPGFQSWTETFARARAGNPVARDGLASLVGDAEIADIARATALLELQPFLTADSVASVQAGLKDRSPLVRVAALRVLDALPPERRYSFASPLLADPIPAVRMEAGRSLAAIPEASLSPKQRERLHGAVAEYFRFLENNYDRADARTNLGNLLLQRGDAIGAEHEYDAAMNLDPKFPGAYINLADLYRMRGRDEAADRLLREGLKELPESALLYHARGLLLVRRGRRAAALAALKTAFDLAPDNARFAYAYGIALNSTGDTKQSTAILLQALERHPYDAEILYALATIYRDANKSGLAQTYARRLVDYWPQDQRGRPLLAALARQAVRSE